MASRFVKFHVDLDSRKVIAVPAEDPYTGKIEECAMHFPHGDSVELTLTIAGGEPTTHIVKLP